MNSDEQLDDDEVSIDKTIQYLTFTLDGDAFATDITRVREVLEYTEIRKVPKMPEYMKGVINLRGSVVPVIDLRMQFGMDSVDVTIETCIIIIEVEIDGHVTVVGALADAVQEVVDLRNDQMEPAPNLGSRVNNKFIHAMGKTADEKFIIVLNMDKVFSAEQIHEVTGTNPIHNDSNDIEAA